MRKLLLIFAHPDDEMLVGGTIARYKKMGWQVDLVFATDFGYSEGKLSALTPGTLEDPIFRAMESSLPDVVITFDQTGISNHPDHIKICFAVTFAFQKYATWLAGLGKKYRVYGAHEQQWLKRLEVMLVKQREPKLYYTCMPDSVVKYLQKVDALPKESFGKPWIGVPDRLITTIIDIQKYRNVKKQALREHLSQRDDFHEEMARANNPEFFKEFYILRMQGTEEIFMGKNDSVSDRL